MSEDKECVHMVGLFYGDRYNFAIFHMGDNIKKSKNFYKFKYCPICGEKLNKKDRRRNYENGI